MDDEINANAMWQLRSDRWAIVARQPTDTMHWEWQVPCRDFRMALDAGQVLSRQRRGEECYLLEAKRRVVEPEHRDVRR